MFKKAYNKLRSIFRSSIYSALLLVIISALVIPAISVPFLSINLQKLGTAAFYEKQLPHLFILTAQISAVLVFVILFIKSRLLKPISKLMRFTDRLALGNFDTQLGYLQQDELGHLGSKLEQMRLAIKHLLDESVQREERFRTIAIQVSDAVFRRKPDNTVEFVSGAIEAISGYKSIANTQEGAQAWHNIVHPIDRERIQTQIADAMAERKSYQVEYRIQHVNGSERWVSENGQAQYHADGTLQWIDGIITDISKRKQMEEKLRLATKVFDNISDGVIFTDANGHIIVVNTAFSTITGYSENDAIGRTLAMLNSARQHPFFHETLWSELMATGSWHGEIWNQRKNGEPYLTWLTINAVRDTTGLCTHYVGIFSDITLIRESQNKLDHLAHHDPLTGLPNRLLFNDRLAQAILRFHRNEQQLAVLFIDLDRFKNINDTLGHHVGDELLKQIAYTLAAAVRDGDTLARLGGDEFIIILEDIDGLYGAGMVAEKIIAVFEQPFIVADHELFLTCSIGISLCPTDGTDINMLIRNADVAMYQAKAHGRNAYRFYAPEMACEGVERLRLDSLLRRSIDNNEIFLNFQPQVDIESGELIGVEALARWNHPELGLVPPIRFIPLAEDSGYINQLGKWVLWESCRQMIRWQKVGLYVPKIAVNLSVKQFERGSIVNVVSEILQETGLDPSRLQLEVTESVIMNNADGFAFINDLHAIGVGLAIDDFGTGYSSLAYLKQLPVQTLKIDRSFIKDISTDPNDEAIAIAIIQLGKSLNLTVIAEGVETQEQAGFLLKQGCNFAQGYFYSHPVLPDDLYARWKHAANQDKSETVFFNNARKL